MPNPNPACVFVFQIYLAGNPESGGVCRAPDTEPECEEGCMPTACLLSRMLLSPRNASPLAFIIFTWQRMWKGWDKKKEYKTKKIHVG